jgi:hypothetical protein
VSVNQGATLAANSWSPTRTASPLRQDSPWASTDSPSEVERTIETSAGEQPVSSAASDRTDIWVSRHLCQARAPPVSCSTIRERIASATRRGSGATAA